MNKSHILRDNIQIKIFINEFLLRMQKILIENKKK